MTVTIAIETLLPEDIFLTLQAHGVDRHALEQETRQLLAANYFRERILSLGKAAKLAAMNYWEFIDFLGQQGVSIVDFSEDELMDEISAVQQVSSQLK